MIISVDKVINDYHLFVDTPKELVQAKLDGLESLIRSKTNNNFQNRNIRIKCPSVDNYLKGASPYFRVGDTVQITNSKVNDGLYLIEEITANSIKLDKDIFDCEECTVTKVEYPDDIVSMVIDVLKWDEQFGNKKGIQSESIGRHSVSYFQQTEQNSYNGYPIHLFTGLKKYTRASRNYR